jgi:hypothetical protein
MSNKEKGDAFKQKVGEYLKKQGIRLTSEYRVDVGLSSKYKKQHAFDLGNSEVLIECKYYDWTESDNNPSAKISTLNEAMLYLYTAPTHFKKKVFIKQTSKKGKRQPETFVEYYVRLYKHFIPDGVEVWEFNDDTQNAEKKHN